MAFLKVENVRIAGFSAGVPKHIENSASTTEKYDAEDFVQSTGIKEKRYDARFTTSDLGFPAAEKLIADLQWDKNEIGALVFVSQTPDYILPATSCTLQDKLGLPRSCMALDISLGCSGWVYGMSVLSSLMQTGCIKKAILLAGDARKQAKEEIDQLFGFACTVTALEYSEAAAPFFFDLGTDGAGYDAIIRPGGGCRNQFDENTLKMEMCDDGRLRHQVQTRMKGMDVFAFGITTAPKSIKRMTANYGLNYLDADYVILHQANLKMTETIRKKLKLESEKVPYSMTLFGNTSSASIPLTIVTKLKGKIEDRLTKLIGCAFGVGLSWGTIAFELNGIQISELVEID